MDNKSYNYTSKEILIQIIDKKYRKYIKKIEKKEI